MSLPRRPIDWKLYDAFEGSDAAFARSIAMDPSQFSREKKRRPPDEPAEHTDGIPAVAPTVYPSHPEHTAVSPIAPVVTPHGIPDIARQSDLDRLQARVEVLEAFIATLQQRGTPVSPNGIPGVPRLTEGTPPSTTKHSFVIAVDLLEAIQRYAAGHHLQVKDALDRLVRTGLAAHGQEVGDER